MKKKTCRESWNSKEEETTCEATMGAQGGGEYEVTRWGGGEWTVGVGSVNEEVRRRGAPEGSTTTSKQTAERACVAGQRSGRIAVRDRVGTLQSERKREGGGGGGSTHGRAVTGRTAGDGDLARTRRQGKTREKGDGGGMAGRAREQFRSRQNGLPVGRGKVQTQEGEYKEECGETKRWMGEKDRRRKKTRKQRRDVEGRKEEGRRKDREGSEQRRCEIANRKRRRQPTAREKGHGNGKQTNKGSGA